MHKTDLLLIGRKRPSSISSYSGSKALSSKLIITVPNTYWFKIKKHWSSSRFQDLYFLCHCLSKRTAASCHLWVSSKLQHLICWINDTQVWKINLRTKGASHSKDKKCYVSASLLSHCFFYSSSYFYQKTVMDFFFFLYVYLRLKFFIGS